MIWAEYQFPHYRARWPTFSSSLSRQNFFSLLFAAADASNSRPARHDDASLGARRQRASMAREADVDDDDADDGGARHVRAYFDFSGPRPIR